MRVLREELQLIPVEYPTTRLVGASPQARADDLMAAFSDPQIRAVLASIGGEDQITVLPYLDPAVLAANPKRFFGYSDNTNLLNYLWNLGIVSYHGGSTMVHLGRAEGPHPLSLASLRQALFTSDTVELAPVATFSDESPDWADESLVEPRSVTLDDGWWWSVDERTVSGPTWGGNLEILHWNLAANRWIGPNDRYCGCILTIETSEEMPPGTEVYRMLRNMGERGLLEQFPAIIVAKALAWHHGHRTTAPERTQFRTDQREAVLRAVARYNPGALVVIGPDFGHTDPQYVIPFGGPMTVDATSRRITMTY